MFKQKVRRNVPRVKAFVPSSLTVNEIPPRVLNLFTRWHRHGLANCAAINLTRCAGVKWTLLDRQGNRWESVRYVMEELWHFYDPFGRNELPVPPPSQAALNVEHAWGQIEDDDQELAIARNSTSFPPEELIAHWDFRKRRFRFRYRPLTESQRRAVNDYWAERIALLGEIFAEGAEKAAYRDYSYFFKVCISTLSLTSKFLAAMAAGGTVPGHARLGARSSMGSASVQGQPKPGEPWRQSKGMEPDPWCEKIAQWASKRGNNGFSIKDVCRDCLSLPTSEWNDRTSKRVARCLRVAGYEPKKVRIGHSVVRRWLTALPGSPRPADGNGRLEPSPPTHGQPVQGEGR